MVNWLMVGICTILYYHSCMTVSLNVSNITLCDNTAISPVCFEDFNIWPSVCWLVYIVAAGLCWLLGDAFDFLRHKCRYDKYLVWLGLGLWLWLARHELEVEKARCSLTVLKVSLNPNQSARSWGDVDFELGSLTLTLTLTLTKIFKILYNKFDIVPCFVVRMLWEIFCGPKSITQQCII